MLIKVQRDLSYRNNSNTNYKVWKITFNVPVIGHFINELLQNYYLKKYSICGSKYIKSCNNISIVKKWYLRGVNKK